MDKAEYMLNSKPWNAEVSDIAQFDAWACTFYETFSNVNRQVWDVFARWKFINTLIDNGRLEKFEADGRILLLEVEEKSSDLEVESEVQEGQQS